MVARIAKNSMVTKETLLAQRAKVAFWSPFVVLLLIGLLNISPFATYETTFDTDTEESGYTIQSEFYPKVIVQTGGIGYDEITENNDVFDGGIVESRSYGDDEGFEEELGDLASEIDDRLSLITTIVLLMFIIGFACLHQRLDANRFLNGQTLMGIGLAVVALLSVTMAYNIANGYSDVFDEEFENIFGSEEAQDVNDGAWGGLTMDFDSDTLTVAWAPSWLFWLGLLVFLISGLGAAANLSFLRKDILIHDTPIWPKGQAPEWLNRDWTKPIFAMMSIAVLVAAFAPWYQVDQEWLMSESSFNEESEVTNSTHDLSWTMSPFYLIFSNDTGLFEGGEGVQSSEFSSYSEHYELSNTAPILLSLRLALVSLCILTLAWMVFQKSQRVRDTIGGPKDGWSLTLMALVTVVVVLSSTSSFEKDFTRKIDDDLRQMSPSLNFTFVHSIDDVSFSGQSFSRGSDFDFSEDTFIQYYSSMEWGPSWGYMAMQIIPWLFVAGLCHRFGPEIIQRLNTNEPVFFLDLDRSAWSARPVVAVMVSALLVTVVGVGPGELLVDSSSGAPGEIYQWDLVWDSNSYGEQQMLTLGNQETVVLSYITSELSLQNTESMYFYFGCDEGDQGLTTDVWDEFDFTIEAPDGVDTTGAEMSGTSKCDGGDSSQGELHSEMNLPESSYAPSEEAYLSLVEIINPLDGEWTITITAQVNEGNDPFASDDDLAFQYYVEFYSFDNIRAEKID